MENLSMAAADIVITALIVFATLQIERSARRTEAAMDGRRFTVRQPRLVFWAGLASCAMFSGLIVLMTLFPNDTAEWWTYGIFIGFALVGALLMVYYVCWRIRVLGDRLVFSSPFAPSREIFLSRITRVVQKPEAMAVYVRERRCFTMEEGCPGYHKLRELFMRKNIRFE